jgi:RHS repeat-associated protein
MRLAPAFVCAVHSIANLTKQSSTRGSLWRIVAVCILSAMGWLSTTRAFANTQWEWWIDGSSTIYPNKGQAIAAMRAASPDNSVLTKEVPAGMDNNKMTYKYLPPPKSPNFTNYVYTSSGCASSGHDYCYASETEAINGLLYQASAPQCPTPTAVGITDWIQYGSPVTAGDRYYNYTYYTYNPSSGCSTPSSANTVISRQRAASCPQYYSLSGYAPYCRDDNAANVYGHPLQPCPCSVGPAVSTQEGNPIDVANSDKFQTETDQSGATLSFVRYYHSATGETSHGMGVGWTHNWAASLVFAFGSPRGLERPDGTQEPLSAVSGGYISQSGSGIHVQASGSNWIVFRTDGTREIYNSLGVFISLLSPAGQITTLSYNTDGTLASVVDPFGHSLQFSYTSDGLLATVTDPAGQTIAYGYDNTAPIPNLTSVTYQDGSTRTYAYENSGLPNHLTGITDESGTRYATFGYDSIGRATSTQHAGGAEAVSVSYGTGSATVTDAISGTTVFTFTNLTSYANRPTAVSHNGLTRNYVVNDPSVDIQQRTTQMTDANGHITNYTYDADHQTSITEAVGTPAQRTKSVQYLSTTTALPTLVTEALKKTSYAYYSGTNLVQTKTVTDTTVTPNVSRTWAYTYDSYGRVMTVDGPRTDVSDISTYTYFTCTTGYQCGQIQTVTNAAGQTTTYNTYNAYGQPLTVTDPNGTVTTLTYDARQRLKSKTTSGETTAFDYWPTGLVKKVTLPDGSYLAYTLDDAHRLTQVTDALGNKTVYTLDAIGNRTATNTYDPSNALHRTHTRVFNTLNQLLSDVNAAGTPAVTTSYGYDAENNQTSVAAPLARNTANAYDELNRLKQITDPASGVTQFGYDANDNLTSVTDPRSLATSYGYSGFGDLKTQVSPDTGTTTNTYDSAGNLATSTDARGAVSTYGHDTLNRVSSVAYSQGGSTDQMISFTYDAGTNGKGHLTGASDANHSLTWSYDALGRVTSKSQTVGSITKSVGYAYTSGNLTTLTTPSGQTVTYGYNANHQVTSVAVNGTTVLNSVTYEPLGPVSGWTWGNGATTTRSYDTDGKISQIVSAGTRTFSYDNAFRITGVTDTSLGAANWTYGYDSLDRLTSGTSSTVTRGWTYDANGNRLTETGSAPSTYTVSSSSNRIASITGALARTYAYDGAGNSTSYSTVTATYNDAGRLRTLNNGSTTETALYNALGQRIQISGGVNGTILCAYDEAGHLLGEYDGTGTVIQETVWLGDIPVATLRPSGPTVAVHYVHSDQLNTPHQVARPSDNAVMWTWNADPFGTDAANSNPAGAGTFAYNVRFPGQLFDGQAGLHYNYFRDFDPATDRYLQGDPIGLSGGINPYVYGYANPLSNIDPDGTRPPGTSTPGISIPLPIPPIVVPGTQANTDWANLAYQQIANTLNPPAACKTCPECSPYKKGTIGFIGPHTDHDHFPIGRPHLNLFVVNQSPSTCKCFWNKNTPDVAKPPPDLDWVDLNAGFPVLTP